MWDSHLPTRLPLDLTPPQMSEYAQIAATLLRQTLKLYAQHLELPCDAHAGAGPHWKLFKRRGDTHVFESRNKHHVSAFHESNSLRSKSAIARSAEWIPQAKMCCVGTLEGSLEDAMYGMVAPTVPSMLARSTMIRDEFVAHRTLADIVLPTDDEPFSYLGLKWSARAPNLASVVKARDLTYIDASGFDVVVNKGREERVGFILSHSVDMVDFTPLSGYKRCRMSLCILYRQTASDIVDFFSTITTDASRELPKKLTAKFTADVLISMHKAIESAMKKKLVWMQTQRLHPDARASQYFPSWNGNARRSSSTECSQCTRHSSLLRALSACEICQTHVCSRCLMNIRLVQDRVYKPVLACKGCVMAALKMDNAVELAVNDFVRPFDSVRDSRPSGFNRKLSHDSFVTLEELRDEEFFVAETVPSTIGLQFRSRQQDRLELRMQIYALRVQAEETYRLTTQHSLALQRSQHKRD